MKALVTLILKKQSDLGLPVSLVTSVINFRTFTDKQYESIHLIVALGFCKGHYETYQYFIRFKRLMYSPLTEIQFLVLRSRL